MTIILPPVTVEPEQLPADLWFKNRPAQYWITGDLLRLRGQIYRIKGVTHSRVSQRIVFTLYPCSGGRPITESFLPRQWGEIARGY